MNESGEALRSQWVVLTTEEIPALVKESLKTWPEFKSICTLGTHIALHTQHGIQYRINVNTLDGKRQIADIVEE